MSSSDWNEIISTAVSDYLSAFPDREAFRESHRPLVERSERVQTLFAPERLKTVTWEEFVDVLSNFENVKASPGRLLRIFGRNDADRLRETVKFALHSREPVDDRISSASGWQLGEGFFSELLCYYRPYQWPIKSTAVERSLARVTTVFQPSEIKELSYDQYRQFLLPILKTFADGVDKHLGDSEWFERYRFLIIYHWLKSTDTGKRGRKRKRG